MVCRVHIYKKQWFLKKVLLNVSFQRGPYDLQIILPASNALTLWQQNRHPIILTEKWVQLDFPEGTQTFTVLLPCQSEFL